MELHSSNNTEAKQLVDKISKYFFPAVLLMEEAKLRGENHPPDASNDETAEILRQGIQNLVERCNGKEQEFILYSKKIRKSDSDNVHFLKEKRAALISQIEKYKALEDSLSITTPSKEELWIQTVEYCEKSAQTADELCMYLREELKLRQEELNTEKRLNNQHKSLNRAFDQELEDSRKSQSQDVLDSEQKIMKNLNKKLEYLSSLNSAFEEAMVEFLEENYPELDPEPKSKKYSKQQKDKVPINSATIQYTSLQEMIEELMNLCLTQPQNPWMDIQSTHWNPYVELLLRSGIAEKEPNSNRIALNKFHR